MPAARPTLTCALSLLALVTIVPMHAAQATHQVWPCKTSAPPLALADTGILQPHDSIWYEHEVEDLRSSYTVVAYGALADWIDLRVHYKSGETSCWVADCDTITVTSLSIGPLTYWRCTAGEHTHLGNVHLVELRWNEGVTPEAFGPVAYTIFVDDDPRVA